MSVDGEVAEFQSLWLNVRDMSRSVYYGGGELDESFHKIAPRALVYQIKQSVRKRQ